jgi:4-carboxymuconolactone decarboxylase
MQERNANLPLAAPGGTLTERLRGLSEDALSPVAREALQQWWPPLNFHRVIAHSPETLRSWVDFGTHIVRDNSLGSRLSELIILRIAWHTQCSYEWGRHERLALKAGVTREEIGRIADDPEQGPWTAVEQTALSVLDEIANGWTVSDAAYKSLEALLTPTQLVDYCFLVGEFLLVAVILNMFQVPLEADVNSSALPSRSKA